MAVPGPDSGGEGVGAVVQDGVGAVTGPLPGQNDGTAVHPEKGGRGGAQRAPLAAGGLSCAC